MIFPEFDFDINEEEVEEAEAADSRIKKSFVFDYKKGQFQMADGSPQEATELQAIEQWLELLLRTKLDKYKIYQNTGFGTSVEDYIGQTYLPQAFIESELEREINEACNSLCPAIDYVDGFTITTEKRKTIFSFICHLKNSDVLEVKMNG